MISVLDSPLFTVITLDGKQQKMGLREVLINAHKIHRLVARTSTGGVALIKLMMTFVEAACHPRFLDDRRRILEAGVFDAGKIDEYINRCVEAGASFFLDDPIRPFMQAAYDESLDAKAEKPVSTLMMDLPSGNNHIFLDHRLANEHALTLSQAFEVMLETYMFCPAGLAGPSNLNNTPPLFAFIRGENLFETLVLNMVSEEELINIPFGAGEEAWLKQRRIVPKQSVPSVSFLEALTFQPRRIRLIIDEDGLVRRVYCQAGLDFRGDGRWSDPNVPYRKTKEGIWTTLKPELGRGVWRDAAMLAASDTSASRPPVPLMNIGDVLQSAEDQVIVLDAVGLITNQAAITGWLAETLQMPKILLQNIDLAEEFRKWLKFTESMNGLLLSAVQREITKDCAAQSGEVFLACMRDEIFGSLLMKLTIGCTDADAYESRNKAFRTAVLKALSVALETVVNKSGSDIKAMKRQENLHGLIMGSCRKRLTEEGF